MISIDREDVPRLTHFAVRQYAVLAHLLLDLLRLSEEPSVKALRVLRRSGEVVDAGLGHSCVVERILLGGQVAKVVPVSVSVIPEHGLTREAIGQRGIPAIVLKRLFHDLLEFG